jgi:AraC-like DNA-binding protein
LNPTPTIPPRAMREVHQIGQHTSEWTVGHPALANRGITMAGISHARPGFEFRTQGWSFGQLLLCFGGEGRVAVHGNWVRCRSGMVYVNPPGVPHAYQATGGEAWKLCWLVYHAPFDQTPLATLGHAAVLHTDPRPLKSAIVGFRREAIGRADPALLRSWADLIHLLGMRVTQGDGADQRLWKVWDAVANDLHYPWTATDLADLVGISTEHLRRLCRQHLGRTPMEHVTYLRMRRAAVLLRTSELKIDTIAEQVAYADRFGFSSAFRRHFGMTPAQFRRAHDARADHGAVTRPSADGSSVAQEAAFESLARANDLTARRRKRPGDAAH